MPFVNLGFSGSGWGEPEVAETMASIKDPALFVLDYEANCSLEELAKTMPDFIAILRAAQREVPILVISKIRYAREAMESEWLRSRERNKTLQRNLVKKLQAAGDRHVHFFDGSKLLGKDYHECAVDGVHPTDFGFFKMASEFVSIAVPTTYTT